MINFKNLTIYFAGKIGKNDWRHDIVYGLRNEEIGQILYISDGCEYIGPFFISCDHGCYHGRSSHGRGEGCIADLNESRQKVFQICLNQILHADIVFAYINDIDAYGTISEIAYAYSNHIPVILFTEENLVCDSDLWFVKKMCTVVDTAYSGLEARHIFLKKYKKLFQ